MVLKLSGRLQVRTEGTKKDIDRVTWIKRISTSRLGYMLYLCHETRMDCPHERYLCADVRSKDDSVVLCVALEGGHCCACVADLSGTYNMRNMVKGGWPVRRDSHHAPAVVDWRGHCHFSVRLAGVCDL